MSFAGGPLNNYTSHGIATMAGVLRADAGAIGLCTANGGYTTEHAVVILSTEPPRAGAYRHSEPQAEVDALPRVEVDDGWVGRRDHRERHRAPRPRRAPPTRWWPPAPPAVNARGARRMIRRSSPPPRPTELVGRSGHRGADGTVELD